MQHSKMTVGSMTMAMKAVRPEGHGPKVLRLGVLEGARIVEERIVRADDKGASSVTIGTDPSCTFVISGDGAPEKHALFVREQNHWSLALCAGIEGRVLMDSKVHAIAELASQRSSIALDESTRGKVTLGATSVLFQFVDAPPIAPKPQLPRTIVRQPLRELDWRYNACLSGFMALAFVGLGYVEYGYDPEIETMDIREEARLVRVDAAPMNAESTPPDNQEAMAAPETPSPSRPQPRNPSSTRNQNTAQNTASQSNSAASRERQAEQAMRSAERSIDATMAALARSTEFTELAHAADGPRSAAAMIRNGQGLMDNSIASLASTTGIRPGTDRPGIQRTGLVASNAPIGPNSLGGPRRVDGPGEVAANTTVPTERVIRTRVTTTGPVDPDPGPGVPINEIAAVFRRNLGAIQSCYTAGLRNNSGLRGRLEVEFTIGTSGRVVGSPSVSGLANGDDVHQCVARRVRGYVFPQVNEATEVMFPVVLEPGG